MLVAVSLLFCLVFLVPGDPASVTVESARQRGAKTGFARHHGIGPAGTGADGRFLIRVVRGDLGEGVLTHRPVAQLIACALPNTLVLALCAIGWVMVLGIPLGCWAALRQNSWADHIIGVLSISVIALPAFVVAILCLVDFFGDPEVVSRYRRRALR